MIIYLGKTFDFKFVKNTFANILKFDVNLKRHILYPL